MRKPWASLSIRMPSEEAADGLFCDAGLGPLMWLEQHNQLEVSGKVVPWEPPPPLPSHQCPLRPTNQLCFNSRALCLLAHSWSLLVIMWPASLVKSASSWPVQFLSSLVLKCWCAPHWLSVFWNEDKNKTENTLEQLCHLLVFPFASSDSHWSGETSFSCSRQWACAQ